MLTIGPKTIILIELTVNISLQNVVLCIFKDVHIFYLIVTQKLLQKRDVTVIFSGLPVMI